MCGYRFVREGYCFLFLWIFREELIESFIRLERVVERIERVYSRVFCLNLRDRLYFIYFVCLYMWCFFLLLFIFGVFKFYLNNEVAEVWFLEVSS